MLFSATITILPSHNFTIHIMINYHNKIFATVDSTDTGEVSSETRFHYRHEGSIVWATYEGGSIWWGTLMAFVDNEGNLDMRYQHLNRAGEFKSGRCQSTPEILEDGRIRLHEEWQWTCDDHSTGTSVIEEVKEN